MIVTVTLNPSLDRTLAIPRLARGEVIRADSTLEDPGGKGVNVTRFLASHGSASIAILPAGGPIGRALLALLDDSDIPYRAIPVPGRTRSNVTVVEPDGTTTKLNEPGPPLGEPEIQRILDEIAELARAGGWVVLAGSLPGGQSTDVVLRVAQAARAAGARFALDASGAALADGLGAHPDLIKPNAEELGEILGRELVTQDEVLAGCDEARQRGAGVVLCSLGGDGAVLVDASGRWHGRGPRVPVVSTVGAGDSLLSGFLHAGGGGPEALRIGIAWATAAVQTPGTGIPPAQLIHPDEVSVDALAPTSSI